LQRAILYIAISAVVSQAALWSEPYEQDQKVARIHVEEFSVCMYGHWLGEDVILEQRGCYILINGYKYLPTASPTWTDDMLPDCDEGRLEFARGQYGFLERILSSGHIAVITPEGNCFVSVHRRARLLEELRPVIQETIRFNEDNWSGEILEWPLVRWIQDPVESIKCRITETDSIGR